MNKFERKTSIMVGMDRPSPKGFLVGFIFILIALLFMIWSLFNSSINWIPIALFGIPGMIILLKAIFKKAKTAKGGSELLDSK